MKNTEFIKLLLNEIKKDLRVIVREEVHKALNTKPTRSDAKSAAHGRKLMDLTEFNEKPATPEENFQFTSNPVLNDVLNKTARTPRQKQAQVPVGVEPEMMEEGMLNFDSSDAQNFPTKKQMLMGNQEAPPNAVPTGVNPNALPDHLKNVFTRDYSGLVDAMAKDSKNKAGIK